jgi:hypothetical protein
MKSRNGVLFSAIVVTLGLAPPLFAQTYYVSPTGSDSNSGLSPSQPWQSLNKVDNTNFSPGSSILFQDGGNWYDSLTATSSGTPQQPITYGSYGSGPSPTFWGSNIIPATSFQPVAGAANTYFVPDATTVNSFFVNHQFDHSAALLSNQTTDAANISYVESNPNSWYYDASAPTPGVYVNTGAPVSSTNVYTAAVRQNAVYSGSQSCLVFQNLTVRETAAANGGYGFRVEGGGYVTLRNDTSIAAGEHAFGAIDTQQFVGTGLNASYLMPDQTFGGASAFVSYADGLFCSDATASWINDTFSNPNGSYQAFITHSSPSQYVATPLASVLVQNLNSTGSLGISVYGVPNEQVTITGGHIDGGQVEISGNNVLVNGILITGAGGAISLAGYENIVQNCIIANAAPNFEAGQNGAIVDGGVNDVIRFNTITIAPSAGGLGAAIGLGVGSSNTQVYGNIIEVPGTAFLQSYGGNPSINAFDNLIAGTNSPMVVLQASNTTIPLASWDGGANAMLGNPMFVDEADGNYSLLPNSPILAIFNPTTGEYDMYDFDANLRPIEFESLGALQFDQFLTSVVPEPASYGLMGIAASALLLRRRRRIIID